MLSSIKFKLIVWLVAVFGVLFAALGFFLYYELSEITVDAVDRHALSEITFLAGLLAKEVEHGHVAEGIYEITEAASGEYAVALSGHYYQLVDHNDEIIGRSPSLSLADKSLPIVARSRKPVYSTLTGPDGSPLRMLSQTFAYPTGEITFQAADSLDETNYVLRSFRNIILLAMPGIFLISISGVYLISGYALKTLNVFSEKIGMITERSLNERVDDEDVDMELQPLAHSFNTMLERLEKFFSRQRDFLSDVSHELRTPTSVIKSHCDVTMRRERSTEEYKESLGIIDKAVTKMSIIIDRIIEASRLDSKVFNLNISEVGLMGLVVDAMKLIESSADEKGIKLHLNGEDIMTYGDSERLSEVFVNIIENAVKYSHEGGRVDINISERGDMAAVSVTDTGIGISTEDQERVFERFYRADKSRTVVAGTGLGLPIVQSIVEAHRGKVEVDSSMDKGSTFTILLHKS